MDDIKRAVEMGFSWLDQQHPCIFKEKSRFLLAYLLWNRDNPCKDVLINELQKSLGKDIRDISRTASVLAVSGIIIPENLRKIKEKQNCDGSWGEQDVYDTTYALIALADMAIYEPDGCTWLVNNFSPDWEQPGTVSLIITALIKQDKSQKTGNYSDFIDQKAQWLCDNEENGGGWKYIATTTIVIDALINAGHNDDVCEAINWLVGKQNSDGSWGKDGKMNNTTAMVLACLAGAESYGVGFIR